MGLLSDAKNIKAKDPAAGSLAQVMLLYPGFHALIYYKVSHWLYRHKRKFLARMVSQWGRGFTNIEIHPGAQIGKHLFIDHGAGVVIGETAVVGNNVTIYHGVTLGGTGKDTGKRHPTIEDDVLIGAGAKILGPIVIGRGSRIGANSTVLKPIPRESTAVGSPSVLVRYKGKKCIPSDDLEQNDFPNVLEERIAALERRLSHMGKQTSRHERMAEDALEDLEYYI
ncbi:MAG: serine O-acetyltransferase EpsC [Oscillospiraceae bacterium]